LQIELDAFSGLPNPRWELSEAQAAEFLTQLSALRPAQDRAGTNDGLGYRGFVITGNGGPVDGYDEVRVYRGTVVARRGDRADTLGDPDAALERWLFGTARGHMDEALIRDIQNEASR
jgi:hypothetical protein